MRGPVGWLVSRLLNLWDWKTVSSIASGGIDRGIRPLFFLAFTSVGS